MRQLSFCRGLYRFASRPEQQWGFERMVSHNLSPQSTISRAGSRSSGTRELILDTATEAFGRSGYHGVKISRLCQQANIANGTFYLHFADKDALYSAVMSRAMQAFLRELATASAEPSVDQAARDMRDLNIILDFASRHPWLAIAVARGRYDEDGQSSDFQKMIVAQRSAEIERQQKNGVFRKDIDAKIAAHAEGAVTTELIILHISDPEQFPRDVIIEQLHGFRARMVNL
jgi:AcrR family transcriptional regulator